MKDIVSFINARLRFEKFPLLTIFSNILLGFAFGKIMMTPGDELSGNVFVKVLLIIGTCLFWNYLVCLRKAGKGITRNLDGKIRPLLKEARSCAYLNASILVISMGVFFLKVRHF